MYSLSNYEAQEEYNKFNDLINNKEILTKEEYDFCVAYDKEPSWKYLNIINYNNEQRYALNINVYSEAEHHERIYQMECGN
jgi:hypothetical protein